MPILSKNVSIQTLTILITSIVSVVTFVFFWIGKSIFSDMWVLLLFPIVLLINYLVVRLFLERYVFRKIKIIYKMIFDSKKEKLDEGALIDIEKVNTTVMEWAESTKKEIATLKSLEEYRKNYVGNISHELKTPIFTIQAYLLTLLEGGLYDEKINKDYLKRAVDNLDRLSNIVEDLDTITKLESGKVQLDIRKFDVKELVMDIFLDLKSIAKKKKITLSFKDDADQNFLVMADRESIRQVFTNLIINSIKYGKDNGVIKVSFYDLDNKILVEISDNGLGIEEKHIRHVFDRFYRIDASRNRKQGGSGLGLSIVKHIIEAHDQTINVRSTLGMGSTFGFTLNKVGR